MASHKRDSSTLKKVKNNEEDTLFIEDTSQNTDQPTRSKKSAKRPSKFIRTSQSNEVDKLAGSERESDPDVEETERNDLEDEEHHDSNESGDEQSSNIIPPATEPSSSSDEEPPRRSNRIRRPAQPSRRKSISPILKPAELKPVRKLGTKAALDAKQVGRIHKPGTEVDKAAERARDEREDREFAEGKVVRTPKKGKGSRSGMLRAVCLVTVMGCSQSSFW
ncbi:hypothetical protein BDV95DRAFT_562210 [Massariosphaeria phaeospora]|uniref:Uncharacterized protein n=1 Tax=Massariosphaeria phaeospora TaxID=100035 RepID=A0A7C8MFD6_9PLEO|nr:hypothetical protein BDV95DRAFT_562210 [Massariosphaeria phaeospora]